jgi:hypothetical protein
VKSATSMSIEAQRLIKLALRSSRRFLRLPIKVQAHPKVCERLQKEDREAVQELTQRYRGVVTFEPREDLHVENIKLINERTGRLIQV